MLRRICNNPACGKVIDGEPPIKKEDPDAALLVRGEPVLWYEDLCPECIERLEGMLADFERPIATAVRAEPPRVPAECVTTTEAAPESNVDVPQLPQEALPKQGPATLSVDEPKEGQLAPQGDRPLANQVVKQFPIPKVKHQS